MAGAIEFEPTREDWVRANRLWYAHHRSRRWVRRLGWAAVALAVAGLLLGMFAGGRSAADAIADVLPVVFFGVALWALPLANRLLIPRQVDRQFEQRPAMADPVRYAWSEHGLSGETRTGTTRQSWSDLHRRLVDRHSHLFLMTDTMLLLIPRRVLTAEQDADLARTADAFGPAPG